MSTQPKYDPLITPIILDTHGSREKHWIARVAAALDSATPLAETRLPTICSGVLNQGRPTLRLPADMRSLQPIGLEHIRNFARRHDLGLLENRRRVDLQPIIERRNSGPQKLADGLGMLLKQAGNPGTARILSHPHRLAMNNVSIPVNELISAISRTLIDSEHCVLTPSRLTEHALGNGMNSIACYTGTLDTNSGPVRASHFISREFRCVGYSAGDQYVIHQLIGGGQLTSSDLWVSRDRLSDGDFRLQVFQDASSDSGFGLFYRTIYLSMDKSEPTEHGAAFQLPIADTHECALG